MFSQKHLQQIQIQTSNSTIETLKKVVNYVQSNWQKHQNDVIDVVLVFLLVNLKIFHTFFQCFYY